MIEIDENLNRLIDRFDSAPITGLDTSDHILIFNYLLALKEYANKPVTQTIEDLPVKNQEPNTNIEKSVDCVEDNNLTFINPKTFEHVKPSISDKYNKIKLMFTGKRYREHA